MNYHWAIACAMTFLWLAPTAGAQVTNIVADYADAFLATGSSNNPDGTDLTGLNFGAAGTLVVASAASGKGEFQSVLKFNLSNSVALFDTNYGAGNWKITGLSLTLTSNYGTGGVQPNNGIFPRISGGQFVIEWLADDDWVEGAGTPNLPTTDGLTYDSLPDLLSGASEILCTNLYTPPGNNVPVTYALPLATILVADVSAGGDVTFLFCAADDQIDYLFNSINYGRGNEPLMQVVVTPLRPVLSGEFTDGGFQLIGVASDNATYQIQASTNLAATNWQTIGVATADGIGNILFEDYSATNAQRFYRLSR
jgi:hypothetical protein